MLALPTYDPETQTFDLFGRSYNVYSLLRMICYIGGYLLLRPYLLKLGGRYQSADHDRPLAADEADSIAATGKRVGANHDDDEDEEDEGVEKGWGVRAVKRAKAEEERRKREIEERDAELLGEESEDELKDLLEE